MHIMTHWVWIYLTALISVPGTLAKCIPVVEVHNMSTSQSEMCGFSVEDSVCLTATISPRCTIMTAHFIWSVSKLVNDSEMIKLYSEQSNESTICINDAPENTFFQASLIARITVDDDLIITYMFETVAYFYKACRDRHLRCDWVETAAREKYGFKKFKGKRCDELDKEDIVSHDEINGKPVNEVCDDDMDCQTELNIGCRESRCQCLRSLFFPIKEYKCKERGHYNEHCFSDLNCRTFGGVYCTNGRCVCRGNTYYNDNLKRCQKKGFFHGSCYISDECNDSLGLVCNDNACICLKTHYFDIKQIKMRCRQKSSYNGVCSSNDQCDIAAGLLCTGGACSCPDSSYWNNNCTQHSSYNGVCSSNDQCDSSTGLVCTDDTCSCPDSSYWNNNCIQQSSYNGVCSSNDQCDIATGVLCTGGTCSCPDTSYWDNICKQRKSFNGVCSSNDQCHSSAGLLCIDQTCSCPDTSYWYNSCIRFRSVPVKIICLENCFEDLEKPNTEDRLAKFYVVTDKSEGKVSYCDWSVYSCSIVLEPEPSNCSEEILLNRTSTHTCHNILVDYLEGNKKFMVEVTIFYQNYVNQTARMFVYVGDIPHGGKCDISPASGIAEVTEFHFTCKEITDKNVPLQYEFFVQCDIQDTDKGLACRNKTHVANVKYTMQSPGLVNNLCRMTAVVTDSVGAINNYKRFFEVVPYNKKAAGINNAVKDITSVTETDGGDRDILDVVSSILTNLIGKLDQLLNGTGHEITLLLKTITTSINADKNRDISDGEDRTQRRYRLREAVVSILGKINVTGSSMYTVQELGNVLNSATQEHTEVSEKLQNEATDLYSNLAERFEAITTNTNSTHGVNDTVSVLMNGVINLLDINSESGSTKMSIMNNSSTNTRDIDVDQRPNYKSVAKSKENSLKLMNTIDIISDIMLGFKKVGESSSVYGTEETTVEVQVLLNELLAGKSFEKDQNITDEQIKTTFTFPNSFQFLESIAGEQSQDVGIQMMLSKQNTYFWGGLSNAVNSPMMSVKLKNVISKDEIRVQNLSEPLHFSFSSNKRKDLHSFRIGIEYYSNVSKKLTNESKAAFKINLPSLQFGRYMFSVYTKHVNLPLRLLVQTISEPTLENIILNGQLKEDESPFFVPASSMEGEIMYIGIALDETVITNASFSDAMLQYGDNDCYSMECHNRTVVAVNGTLEVYISACLYWNDNEQTWSEEGCMVAPYTTIDTLHCWCTHLTSFSSSFLVMPNIIRLEDFALFSTFFSNPVVVIAVVIVWGFYFILLYWTRKEDNKDVFMGSVYVLEDNNPSDMYMYLVCVITRWWTAAGTTANVFIQLKGSDDYSSRHCFSDIPRQCFRSGTEEWFLITTPNSLGTLESIHVWHDNSGESPSWFLNRIVVKDIQTSKSSSFLFNDWLSANRGILSTQVDLLAMTPRTQKLYRRTNFMFMSSRDMRDSHLWISIFSKLSISTFTRVQRLTCALCFLLSSMLASIMFHGIPTDDPDDQLKYGDLHISFTDVVIGIESSILLFPINFLILQIFIKLSPKPQKASNRLRLSNLIQFGTMLKATVKEKKILKLKEALKCPRTQEKALTKNISNLKVDKFIEIDDLDPAKVKVPWRLPWWFLYIAWFLVISTSMICSFFVMLYGLKYGYQKSVDWLVSFLSAFFYNNALMEPIKVIAVAVVFAIILKRPVKVENRNEDKDLDEDEEYVQDIDKATSKINTSTPVPLSKKILELVNQRLKIDAKVFETINDMALYLMYLFIILFMVHGHRPVTSANFCNRALENILINNVSKQDVLALDKVFTVASFWKYIHGKIALNLEKMANPGDSFPYATSNFILIGPYRLRQLRVKEDSCEYPHNHYFELLNLNCSSPYWLAGEDSICYNGSWATVCAAVPKTSAWKHQIGWELQSLPYIGNHGSYSGGGYVLEMSSDYKQSKNMLESFENSDWIDERTRAVFLEFTLYNPNSDLFSVFLALFEFPSTGSIDPSHKIFTSKLFHYTNGLEIFVAICEVAFVGCTIAFTYHEIKRYRKLKSRKEYFANSWSFVEVIQICLSYAVIGLFIQRAIMVNQILNYHKESGGKIFVSFFTAISVDFLLGYTMAALVGLVIVKAFKLLEFNKRTFMLIDTLRSARNQLFQFSVQTFLFMSAFTSFAVIIFGPFLKGYSSISNTLLTLFNFALGTSDFFGLTNAHSVFGPIFFFMFIFFVQWTYLTMFVAIVNFSITSSQKQNNKRKNALEFIDYFWEKAYSLLPYTEKNHIKQI